MANKDATTPPPPNAVDRAIAKGAQQTEEEDTEIALPLTAEQERKVDELCDVLGLSMRSVLNTAIKYTLFYMERKRLEPATLRNRQERGSEPRVIHFEPTVETDQKLRDTNMTEYVDECARTGVDLLYERLIPRGEKAA